MILVILIPAIAIFIALIKLIFNIRGRNNALSAFAWTFWALALVFVIISLLTGQQVVTLGHHYKDETRLEMDPNKILYIDLERELLADRNLDYYSIFGKEVIRDKFRDICYLHPSFSIESSESDDIRLTFLYNSVIPDFEDHNRYDREYSWNFNDTILILSNYMKIDENDIWLLPGLRIILSIPNRRIIYIDNDLEEITTETAYNSKIPEWYYNNILTMKDDELILLND